VRVGGAQERGVEHPGQVDVVGEQRTPGEQAWVLVPAQRFTKNLVFGHSAVSPSTVTLAAGV
jgi:hypothetical protein